MDTAPRRRRRCRRARLATVDPDGPRKPAAILTNGALHWLSGSRGPGAMYSPKTRLASSNARSRVSWSVVHGTHNSLTGFKRAPDNFVPLGERLLDPFQRWMTSVLDLDLLPPKD